MSRFAEILRGAAGGDATALRVVTLVVAVGAGSLGCGGDRGESGEYAGGGEPEPNTLTAAEIEQGWRLLFDGETSSGWRGYNRETFPESGWEVREGALVLRPTGETDAMSGGDIVTEARFGSFDLRFEFKLTPEANSGVFYLVQERDDAEIWHLAPEYQVLDDSAYLEMEGVDMTTHLSGENYDLHSASVRPLRPPGEWNQGRIVVDGTHVEHWLNGELMVEYEIRSPDWEARVSESKFAEYPDYGRAEEGPIGLQDHGREVWFRSLKIRRLDESVALFNGRDLAGWRVHGTERWYVEDGELVCESGPDEAYGYLATERSFRDFDLTLDFKQEANGNSGVFFRARLDGTRISGWQAEVAPPGRHTGGIYESYGRGWLVRPDSAKQSALRMGEWNTLRLRAVGDRVTTWLNGRRMVELEDEKIGEADGVIALQIHDGGGIKVRWRDIRLTELE